MAFSLGPANVSYSEEQMANGGWYGSDEEWQRAEAPIKSLDPELERFANLHSLKISRNHKDWPDRSMVWDDRVRCSIQFYLDDVETLGVNLWNCASQDRGGDRYWKQEFLFKGKLFYDVAPQIVEFLDVARSKLDHWNLYPDQLDFATKVARV